MEQDLAENLDDLICAGSLNVDGSNYNVWYKIVGLLFVVWIAVAGLVYLVANYLIQSPPSNSSTTEVNSDISTDTSSSFNTEQSNESEKVTHKENGSEITIEKSDPPKITESNAPKIPITSVPEMHNIPAPEIPIAPTIPIETVPIIHKNIEEKLDICNSIGSDKQAVEWINSCLGKILELPTLRSTLVQLWLDAASKYTQSLEVEEGVSLVYEGILPGSPTPKFTNLVTMVHPNDNMTVTMDIDIKDVPIKAKIVHSIINVEIGTSIMLKQLRGRGSVTILSRERTMIAKLEGYPVIHLDLQTSGRANNDISKEIMEIVKDLSVSAFRGSQVNINMEDFDGSDVTPFPVFIRRSQIVRDPPIVKNGNSTNHEDTQSTTSMPPLEPTLKIESPQNTMYPTLRKKAKRFLHICIAKVANLANCEGNPYVVTELDEPNQRHKTEASSLISDSAATWNQTFTFELTNMSKEVLFEVWNQPASELLAGTEIFLGLGIVSVDELGLNESQRLIVPLQGMPENFNDNSAIFGGLLTVHFLLTKEERKVEASEITNGHLNENDVKIGNGNGVENGNGHIDQEMINMVELISGNGITAAETEVETKLEEETNRPARLRNKRDSANRFKKRASASASLGRSATSLAPSSVSECGMSESGMSESGISESTSRSRSKRRSAKEKITDQFNNFITGIRSMSADRIRSASQNRNRGAHSNLAKTCGNGSDSDLSNVSGISGASAKTYITEESSLVLECSEKVGQSTVLKHYLVPYDLAKRKKFKRGSTKLHIYMDHVFVAQRVKSGTTCAVCLTSIPFRLGKQAYICRDCQFVCHKPCHIKVPDHCMETSLPKMELLFLDDGRQKS